MKTLFCSFINHFGTSTKLNFTWIDLLRPFLLIVHQYSFPKYLHQFLCCWLSLGKSLLASSWQYSYNHSMMGIKFFHTWLYLYHILLYFAGNIQFYCFPECLTSQRLSHMCYEFIDLVHCKQTLLFCLLCVYWNFPPLRWRRWLCMFQTIFPNSICF